MNKRSRRVLWTLLEAGGRIKKYDVQKKFNRSRTSLNPVINKLQRKGLVSVLEENNSEYIELDRENVAKELLMHHNDIFDEELEPNAQELEVFSKVFDTTLIRNASKQLINIEIQIPGKNGRSKAQDAMASPINILAYVVEKVRGVNFSEEKVAKLREKYDDEDKIGVDVQLRAMQKGLGNGFKFILNKDLEEMPETDGDVWREALEVYDGYKSRVSKVNNRVNDAFDAILNE